MVSIEVLSIKQPRKPSCLAEASARISTPNGDFIVVSDLRIIRNKNAQLWVALPTFSVKEGNGWRYEATVELSRGLQRQLEDAVLAAFEEWERRAAPAQGAAR